ncbi:hypothetical protein [Paraburkholderia adhaesiva]|uniref:hypothetical protein n=1 Tax=Paraburkholderia adhaesiva TaxID=2883244 RepID=UPI001F171472|nr:hypothetical protein [Paraburkholderia adhaesiva]
MPYRPLEPGDMITIRVAYAFEPDRWIRAVVFSANDDTVSAMFMEGPQRGMWIALRTHERNRTWKSGNGQG